MSLNIVQVKYISCHFTNYKTMLAALKEDAHRSGVKTASGPPTCIDTEEMHEGELDVDEPSACLKVCK